MNTKLKSWLLQLLQSPRRFPVELALGLVFFVIAVCDTRGIVWHQAQGQAGWGVNGDVLWLFAPLLAIAVLAWLCVKLEASGVFDAIRSAVSARSVP